MIMNRIPLPERLKFDIIFLAGERLSYAEIEYLLEHMNLKGKEKNWVYQFLYAGAKFFNEDYHSALQMYNQIDTSDENIDYYSEIEILYKQAASLWHTKQRAHAVLQWREILFSGDYDSGYSRFYYHAMVDLGRYYVQICDSEEADKVLSKMDQDDEDFVEDLVGKDYFLFRAEKALLNEDKQTALTFYLKAREVHEEREIAIAIQKLSEGE